MASGPALFDLGTSEGVNESERILTRLCQKSFLRLWAQSNIFTDEGFKDGRGSVKELCDALVVFGNDVLVFSDKHIKFHSDKPLDVAWPRWYKRAVVESLRQLQGAKNWLQRFPDRAFLDGACKRPLPVPVPTGPHVKFHLIAVTRGTQEAVLATKEGLGLGSLTVNTGIQGNEHLESPFTVGKPDPKKSFVHVFDEVTVDLLMKELDTAADFIEYLNEREALLGRDGLVVVAQGEEDLLALYLQTMSESGEKHTFLNIQDGQQTPVTVMVDSNCYASLQENAAYQRKKHADKISYVWDELVTRFIELGDPALNLGLIEQQEQSSLERGLRLLAAEPRFKRRQLASALMGALDAVGSNPRLARVVNSQVPGETVFTFLIKSKREQDSYDEYRKDRLATLHAYCRVAKLQAPQANIFVGLAFDNPHTNEGGSEDLFVYEQEAWSAEDLRELEKMRDELNILGANTRFSRFRGDEYPGVQQEYRSTPKKSPAPTASSRKKDSEKNRKKMQKLSKRRNRR